MVCDYCLQLKVDKIKLIELCGTSESEFSSVSVLYAKCDEFIRFVGGVNEFN
jgi:hypothetical protein